MGAKYAGILGPVALLTTLARGLIHGGNVEGVLFDAWIMLLAFAAIGYVIGRLADWTVEESVHASLRDQMVQHQSNQSTSGEAQG